LNSILEILQYVVKKTKEEPFKVRDTEESLKKEDEKFVDSIETILQILT